MCRDQTELKDREQRIVSLAKFPSENPDPVLRISKDGLVIYANESGARLLSEWEGGIEQNVPQEWEKFLVKAFASSGPKKIEMKQAD